MNLFTSWLMARTTTDVIGEFADSLGNAESLPKPIPQPPTILSVPPSWPSRRVLPGMGTEQEWMGVRDPYAVLGNSPNRFVRTVEFSDNTETLWEDSRRAGFWRIGLLELPLQGNDHESLVGVVSATSTVTAAIISDLQRLLGREHAEPAAFSLRNLLSAVLEGATDMTPRSVRLLNESGAVLVQDRDVGRLRQLLGASVGEIGGLTLAANSQRVTVLADGEVIFADSATLPIVTTVMLSIYAMTTQVGSYA